MDFKAIQIKSAVTCHDKAIRIAKIKNNDKKQILGGSRLLIELLAGI